MNRVSKNHFRRLPESSELLFCKNKFILFSTGIFHQSREARKFVKTKPTGGSAVKKPFPGSDIFLFPYGETNQEVRQDIRYGLTSNHSQEGTMQYQAERSTWDMWYPWPPFHLVYENEPGLALHLTPQECQDIVTAVSAAFSGVGAAVANVLGAFAGVIPIILSHLVLNGDGSMDVHIAPHGFLVGNLPAADPNVWVDGVWAPVAAALWQLPAARTAPSRGGEEKKFDLPAPTMNSHGLMIKTIPMVLE
jgi:hypothetical protein